MKPFIMLCTHFILEETAKKQKKHFIHTISFSYPRTDSGTQFGMT